MMFDLQDFIPVAKICTGEQEIKAITRVIRSGWVTQGPEVSAFEQEFAAYVGTPHACAVSSCTTALHLALLAVGVKPGDEVITASHSFIATANSIRYCGAKPVFVDIQPDTFNIDPALIERAITSRTKAILCVHQMGMPCDLNKILKISHKHSLRVIEDAACAIGSEILMGKTWEKIGKPHGDIACFSFHPRKIITTGDGGMLTTNNAEWDKMFRLWRNQGMNMSASKRDEAKEVIFATYPVLGYNYRMTDIQAAIGREQLTRLPQLLKERFKLVKQYRKLLVSTTGLSLHIESPWARSNWQSFCVRLPQGCSQHNVMQHMRDKGIATLRGTMCAHREASYINAHGQPSLPVSEEAQDQTIILPLFSGMLIEQQKKVVEILNEAITGRI